MLRGHRVVLILHRHHVIGLHNASSGEQVNCLRASLPSPLQERDILLALACMAGTSVCLGVPWGVMALGCGLAAAVLRVMSREWYLRRSVDRVLKKLAAVSQ